MVGIAHLGLTLGQLVLAQLHLRHGTQNFFLVVALLTQLVQQVGDAVVVGFSAGTELPHGRDEFAHATLGMVQRHGKSAQQRRVLGQLAKGFGQRVHHFAVGVGDVDHQRGVGLNKGHQIAGGAAHTHGQNTHDE